VEKLEGVVLKSPAEGGRHWYWPGLSGWYITSPDNLLPATSIGAGRLRTSSLGPYPAAKEPMEAKLDVESELRWWGRALSVRTCRGNLAGPVAARESTGISSLTCTVWACWRRLSSLENRREQ
jgi:hypothetical protein